MAKIKDVAGKEKASDIVNILKQKTIDVPLWNDLKQEYDPKLHPVMTDPNYKDKVVDGILEKVTRIIFGLQRLATNRMTQFTFGIPVKRVYKPKDDNEKRGARILEDIFTTNHIDTVNMQRGVMFFAGCEMATLWYAVEGKDTYYDGEKSLLKIRCKNYSPMDSEYVKFAQTANLYPTFNEYDDMVAMSFEYSRKIGEDTINYFDVYTDEEHIRYSQKNKEEWKEDVDPEGITIEKIPVVYGWRAQPIWGDTSQNLSESEWTVSRNGNYLRKNLKPLLGIYSDEVIDFGKEKDVNEEFRTLFQLSENGKMEYVTYPAAIEALKFQIQEIRQNFFAEVQLPDISSESLRVSNVSADALQIMLLDSQLKVTQESGDLIEYFERETSVVKALAAKAYPSLAESFKKLRIEHLITPYFVNSDETKANTLSTATGGKPIMSQKTAISLFGQVDDAEEELKQIQREQEIELSEPTNFM